MKSFLAFASFAILAGAALAQEPQQKRIDAIWDAASARMAQQNDVWFDEGDFLTAIQLLTIENELYPADYDLATDLGWMQENVEDWDGALATYIRYRRLNPTDPDAALPEGQFYYMRKAYAKVPPLLEPIIKNDKAHANNFRILAHSYERLNMLTDAKRVWERFIAIAPGDGAAKVNLKRVEAKLAKKTGGV